MRIVEAMPVGPPIDGCTVTVRIPATQKPGQFSSPPPLQTYQDGRKAFRQDNGPLPTRHRRPDDREPCRADIPDSLGYTITLDPCCWMTATQNDIVGPKGLKYSVPSFKPIQRKRISKNREHTFVKRHIPSNHKTLDQEPNNNIIRTM